MAIANSYPMGTPKSSDLLLGTRHNFELLKQLETFQ